MMERRPLSLLLVAGLSLDLTGCAVRSYHPAPVTDLTAEHAKLGRQAFRLTTPKGKVVLVGPTIAFPYVEGVAEPGDGRVELDLGTVRGAREFHDDKWSVKVRSEVPITREALAPAGEPRFMEFDTPEGNVRLAVVRVSETTVWGMPQGGTGRVRVDVRDVTRLEVGNAVGSKANVRTVLAVAGVALVVLFVVAANSLSDMDFGVAGPWP